MPADISGSLKDWSTTAASNAPAGTTAISTNLDDNLRELQKVVRAEVATNTTLASATTTDLGSVDAHTVNITGSTTITGFGTVSAGIRRKVWFSGALTLTHNGTSLILPTASNITTAAGDSAEFVSLGSGNWRCLWFQRANGIDVGVPTLVSGQFLTNNGTALQWSSPTSSITIASRTGNYTAVAADRGSLISGTGTWTLTLTAAATLGAGWWCYVENAGSGQITISSASNVDGISGGFIMYPGEQRTIICDGSNFKTLLLRGGTFTSSTPGAVSFKAPPGVPANGFHIRAVAAGEAGLGNGTTAGNGGRGGTGAEFRVSMTAGTTYTGSVGDGAGASATDRATSLTGVFNINDGLSSFIPSSNVNTEGVFGGGAGGTTAGAAPGNSIYGGGGGAAGNGGAGGASAFSGAGGAAGSVGASPGGGGGGGTTTGTLGQRGGHGLLVISW